MLLRRLLCRTFGRTVIALHGPPYLLQLTPTCLLQPRPQCGVSMVVKAHVFLP
jgi:hypothetical protein